MKNNVSFVLSFVSLYLLDRTGSRNGARLHHFFHDVFQNRVRLEAAHDVADAACSIDQMRKLAIDLFICGDSVQNVIVDVTQNFTFDVDGGFGV